MRIKKTFLLFLFSFPFMCFSQDSLRWELGIVAQANLSHLDRFGIYEADQRNHFAYNGYLPGSGLGIYASYSLCEVVKLHAGLQYASYGGSFQFTNYSSTIAPPYVNPDERVDIKFDWKDLYRLQYVELPFTVRWIPFPQKRCRPFLELGVSYMRLVRALYAEEVSSYPVSFTQVALQDHVSFSDIAKKNVFNYLLGMGIQFQPKPKVSFQLSLRYSYSFGSIFAHDKIEAPDPYYYHNEPGATTVYDMRSHLHSLQLAWGVGYCF